MMMFTFSVFRPEIPLLGKFDPKIQNSDNFEFLDQICPIMVKFRLKFGNQTNLNMENSMVMFTVSLFGPNN